jgi:hypothetical protein
VPNDRCYDFDLRGIVLGEISDAAPGFEDVFVLMDGRLIRSIFCSFSTAFVTFPSSLTASSSCPPLVHEEDGKDTHVLMAMLGLG